MRAMALHSGLTKPRSYLLGAAASRMKSPEASPTAKGLSSVARSSQTRSGKRKTSTLTLDDAIKPIRTLTIGLLESRDLRISRKGLVKVLTFGDNFASIIFILKIRISTYIVYNAAQWIKYHTTTANGEIVSNGGCSSLLRGGKAGGLSHRRSSLLRS
ncbi:hypothetical protein ACOSP7_004713 [Xanthoceras sorbifolium]